MEDDRLDVPEFDDPKWVMDLAFLVDVTQELNILHPKLRGALAISSQQVYMKV